MRHQQAPLDALRADLAASPGNADVERAGGEWLVVAQALHRLSGLPPAERRAYVGRLVPAWRSNAALMQALPEALLPALADVHDGGGDAVDRFQRALATLTEAIERAGAFHLAYTMLGLGRAICPLASAHAHGLLLVQQARVARQLGDLASAAELYASAEDVGREAGDDEVRGRGAVGRGILANMRGNYPAAREAFRQALAVSGYLPAVALHAHHGLMTGAIAAGDVETALVHGWRTFAGTMGDADRRADLLANLGEVARMAHAPEVAMSCYLASLRLTRLDRIRLAALGGAVLAAAELGDVEQLDVLTGDADAVIARANQPYENAFTLIELAESHAAVGRIEAARGYAARAAALAAARGFHEVAHRVELVRARLDAAAPASRLSGRRERVLRSLTGAAEDVLDHLARLPADPADLVALEV